MNDYQIRYRKKKEEQLELWRDMITELFDEIPNSKAIHDPNEIIHVLSTVGVSEALNHTFFPSGGGLDLTNATFSNEDGKVELQFGSSAKVIKPHRLTFHAVGSTPEWWYFRLDALPFNLSGVYDEQEAKEEESVYKSDINKRVEWLMSYSGEELLEISPGEYMDRSYWEINHLGFDENGQEIPLPSHARVIDRQHPGGSYVIFPKYSKYNNNSSTYDARHNKGTDEEFRNYIQNIVEQLNIKENK